jgi:uncharacterized protein YgiM (DUF1202 family)
MPEPRKLRVFLCHASQDKPVVRELCKKLKTEGWIDPWLDEEKLLPGQKWQIEIPKAVENAHTIIICLSSVSVNKEGYIQKELKFALDLALEKPEDTIFIIPLRLDDCEVPQAFKEWQWVDYFPDDKKMLTYQRLLTSLKLRAGRTGSRSYRVKVNALNIRENADTKYKRIGQLSLGEVVERLDANSDETWIKIRRSDDLVGWCSAKYLSEVVYNE